MLLATNDSRAVHDDAHAPQHQSRGAAAELVGAVASDACSDPLRAEPLDDDAKAGCGVACGRTNASKTAAEVMSLLLREARLRAWGALPSMCLAVAERLYPVRPDLACSWALRYTLECFGADAGSNATFAAGDRDPDGAQRMGAHLEPRHPPLHHGTGGHPHPRTQEEQQQRATRQAQAAAAGAPHLMAVLGLPLLIATAQELLRNPDQNQLAAVAAVPGARAGPDARGPTVHGMAQGPGRHVAACPRVAHLLAAIAALGGEGRDAVWGMLGQTLGPALGGPQPCTGAATDEPERRHPHAYHPGAAGKAAAGGEEPADLRLAVMVLAAAEVVLEGRDPTEESRQAGGDGHPRAGGASFDTAAAVAASCGHLEAMLGPLLQDHSGLRRGAILRAVQQTVPYATSAVLLGCYERSLQAARSAAAAAARAGAAGAAGAARAPDLERLDLALATVQSRKQHLAGAQGHAGGREGAAATAASTTSSTSGDVKFTGECLAEFDRLGEDHVKKMAGPFHKAGWQQRVKPVLLRPTLDAGAARRVHGYLKACAQWRLVTVTELDRWEQLQTQLGMELEEGRPGGAPAAATHFRPVAGLLHKLAEVGPSLDSAVLGEIMARLGEAMAEELRAAAEAAAAGGEAGGGGAEERAPHRGDAATAVAAELVEMVLQAFVAAEDLCASAAAAAPPHAPSPQSHLGWQLALVEAVARLPALHAPLGRRLMQLATELTHCAELDEPQVLGLAAALACASVVRIRDGGGIGGDGGGDRAVAAEARFVWRLPPPGGDARTLAAAAAVPGPALAAAALGALPLGPSPRHVRFSATLIVSYFRLCAALGRWVLHESPAAAGVAATWPQSFPVRASAPVAHPAEGGDGAAAAGRRRRRQGQDAAGCVPTCALQTLLWIERYAAAFGGSSDADGATVAPDGGCSSTNTDKGSDCDAACWRDVSRMCGVFRASPLGAAMLAQLAENSPGGDAGQGPQGRDAAAVTAPDPGWDAEAATRLAERSLRQGLGMPPQLLREQARLLVQCMGGAGTAQPQPQPPQAQAKAIRLDGQDMGYAQGGGSDTEDQGWEWAYGENGDVGGGQAKRLRAV